MKKNIFILGVVVAFFCSCGNRSSSGDPNVTQTVTLDTASFKDCPVQIDIPGDWSKPSDVTLSARFSRKTGLGDFIVEPLKVDSSMVSLETLKTMLASDRDYKDAKFTEDLKLKNGVGVKFDKPSSDGKTTEKNFIIITTARGKCFLVHNNNYYDTKYEYWDVEKKAIESMR